MVSMATRKGLFFTELALRKWFPWQQGKVYFHGNKESFDSDMLPNNIGKNSRSFKKISFVVLELLRKT